VPRRARAWRARVDPGWSLGVSGPVAACQALCVQLGGDWPEQRSEKRCIEEKEVHGGGDSQSSFAPVILWIRMTRPTPLDFIRRPGPTQPSGARDTAVPPTSRNIENSLVVTGKHMKRTLKKTPEKPKSTKIWRSKRLSAWRTCKSANSQVREPSSPHPQHLHPFGLSIIDQAR
jgi:hypothetical protein